MEKRRGRKTAALAMPVYVRSFAAAVGKKEGEGPLKRCFSLCWLR